CFAELVEEFILGTIHPAAMNRRWLLSGNLPELLEAAEMIEANVIAGLCGPAQPTNPPVVASRAHGIPIVERIAPALAGRAESIRRHAGDHFGLKIVPETIKILVGPNIGAIVVDKNRDVSHYANRSLGTVQSQGMPLLPERKLDDPANRHLRG